MLSQAFLELDLDAGRLATPAAASFTCLAQCNHSKQLFVAKTVHSTNEPDLHQKDFLGLCTKLECLGTMTNTAQISHVSCSLRATRRQQSSADAVDHNPSGIQSEPAPQAGGALIALQSGAECAASLVFFLFRPFSRPG